MASHRKVLTLQSARNGCSGLSLHFSSNVNTTSQNNQLWKATRCILWITGNLGVQNHSTLAVLSNPVMSSCGQVCHPDFPATYFWKCWKFLEILLSYFLYIVPRIFLTETDCFCFNTAFLNCLVGNFHEISTYNYQTNEEVGPEKIFFFFFF